MFPLTHRATLKGGLASQSGHGCSAPAPMGRQSMQVTDDSQAGPENQAGPESHGQSGGMTGSSLTWGSRAPPGEQLEVGLEASQLVVVSLVLQITWTEDRRPLQRLACGSLTCQECTEQER